MSVPGWLLALFVTAFVLYTDDYVIAGILPELADDLGVSVGQAGQLVTVFSLTVAVAAPVAAVLFASVRRRRLFTVALVLFIGANLAAAATPSFAALLLFRFLAALAAASCTPALFAFAARNAPTDQVGRFLAVISLGITGSIAAGVPIGTWIGGEFGWRTVFSAMAAAGVLALLLLLWTLPRGQQPDPVPPLREQLQILRRRAASMGLLANCVLMTGSMMLLTYLAAYLADTTTGGVDARALAFGLAGVAGTVGIWLAGLTTDRWGADRALLFGVGTIVVAMIALWGFWAARPVPVVPVLAVTTLWGAMAFWNSPAIQARLHALAGPVAGQALALNTSGTYLGVSAGAAIGGLLLSGVGAGGLPLVAAGCAVGALLLLALTGPNAQGVAT